MKIRYRFVAHDLVNGVRYRTPKCERSPVHYEDGLWHLTRKQHLFFVLLNA